MTPRLGTGKSITFFTVYVLRRGFNYTGRMRESDVARLFLILRRKFLTQQTEARRKHLCFKGFRRKEEKYEDFALLHICRGLKM